MSCSVVLGPGVPGSECGRKPRRRLHPSRSCQGSEVPRSRGAVSGYFQDGEGRVRRGRVRGCPMFGSRNVEESSRLPDLQQLRARTLGILICCLRGCVESKGVSTAFHVRNLALQHGAACSHMPNRSLQPYSRRRGHESHGAWRGMEPGIGGIRCLGQRHRRSCKQSPMYSGSVLPIDCKSAMDLLFDGRALAVSPRRLTACAWAAIFRALDDQPPSN